MNKHIVEFLDYYIHSENVSFAVLLKGNWGTGKTFFIKKLINEWTTPIVKDREYISLNPIYISLNGLSSKKEIIEKLKAAINPFLYSKGVKFASSIFKNFLKATVKIDLDYDNDGKNDANIDLNWDPISIFKSDNENIKGNRILIFDDIERCKIPMDEIYGFINDFVEHSKCKVILISDEQKIIDKEQPETNSISYITFKEKIIGQTFEIKPSAEEAIDYFISQTKPETIKILSNNRDLILSIFSASEHKNLRVIQRGIFNFERLVSLLDSNLRQEDVKMQYEILMKSFLAYYLIFHIEFNTGNLKIKNFQQLFLSDENKYDNQNYEEAIKSFDLIHLTKIFTAENLIDYISNGNYESLIKEINNCSIFHPSTEKNWEKLWYWKFLDDEEFKHLIPLVEEDFFKGKDLHFTEVLHITGILFNLIDNGLYTGKEKSEISDQAKHIFAHLEDLGKIQDLSLIARGSWGKAYASENTAEFKKVLDDLRNAIKLFQKKEADNYITHTVSSLTNENIDELYASFKKYDPESGNILEKTSIFKDISAEKMTETIINLNNRGIFDLNSYFNYRYYPERTYVNFGIEDYHREELQFILKLKKCLSEKIQDFSRLPIKEKAIATFINDLEKISLKLQS